ncbi:MAG: FAD:protein FMN transferase [Chloroflexota bacterium]
MTTQIARGARVRVEQVRVEHVMGTAIVIDVRDQAIDTEMRDRAIEAAFAHLRDVDQRFSTYKPDSEVSRLNAGEVRADRCSPELTSVLEMCDQARIISDGYFDIRGHRSDGMLDPSGMVKGWSVDGAARILDDHGLANYSINAAGDVLTRGEPEPGMPWRIGLRNPWDAQTTVAVVEGRDMAIATSATYERGEHVIVPRTGRPPSGVASMTVVGHSLTWADTWATAAFAMGVRGVDWVARELDGYEACAVSVDRHLVTSAGFERWMGER